MFDDFELDAGKVELRKAGANVGVEPQVFSLLLLLVENRERLVSKDEIIEKIWDGRIVSESALTSRIKFARQALGDDGKTQKYIRTLHGQGFRFVAEARTAGRPKIETALTKLGGAAKSVVDAGAAKPSIAVLPFRLVGIAGPYATIADALPHELISELSRLRWLFVIARASSFRFRSTDPDIEQVGKALNVRYCLSGIVEIAGDRLNIAVELADTRDGGVVWGDRFSCNIADIHEIRGQIISKVIAALEIYIPLNEARAARLASPENLDAWAAYHLGLQHMFRFNAKDNAEATAMFECAIAKEPDFARAHAGLSFTHFQNVFLRYSGELQADRTAARRYAERGIELDRLDPFVNFTMGRAHWLESDLDGSLSWLDRAISLSPNYAQGVYAKSWADTISGRGAAGEENANLAMELSPLDPFFYAMLGTRALSHLVRGDDRAAARWADEAARAPGAHVLIAMIAMVTSNLNGERDKAAIWAANVRERNPNVTKEYFFQSFPFKDEKSRARISKAISELGF